MLSASRRRKYRLIAMLLFLAVFSGPPVCHANPQPSGIELEEKASQLETRWTGESLRRAIELSFAASEAFRKMGDFSRAAQSLRRAARLQNLTVGRDNALATLKRALDFNTKLPPLEAIKTLALYSRLLIENSDASKAVIYIEKARRLSERAKDPTANGLVLRMTGELNESRGEFAAAEAEYVEAIRLFRQSDDEGRLARTLLLLAGVRISLGNAVAGLENADEAKGIFTKTGDVRQVARSQIIRGHFLGLLGRKQEALDEYLDAEEKLPADIDRFERARLLAGIGYAYQDLGELRLSLVKRREAIEVFEQEKQWLSVAYGLSVLIDLNLKLGDEQTAFGYLERSRDLAGRTGNSLPLAASHGFVGDYYFEKKEDDRASMYYRQALPVLERAKLAYLTATVNDKLGSIFLRKRQNKLARRHFDTSLELSRQIQNGLLEANSLYNLARLELDEGRTLDALRLSQASIDHTEKLSASVRNSRLRSSHFASVCERYDLHILLLMRAAEETGDPRYVRQAFQAAERSRARSMLEKLAQAEVDLIADAPLEMLQKDKELRTSMHAASDRLANLLNSGADSALVRKVDEELAVLQHELEELRSDLKRNSPVYSAIKDPPPFDIGEFQRNVLDERSVLLEFYTGKDESYAWLVDKNEVSGFRLPGRDELKDRISSLNEWIRSREPRTGEPIDEYQQRIAFADEKYWLEAQTLSSTILGPASSKIEGRRLIVVADGALHHLSFSALPFPGSGGQKLLLDSNDVIYQPSAQALSFLTELPGLGESSDRRDLVVFSDPVFTSNDERLNEKKAASPENSSSLAASFRFVESLASLTRLRGSGREADAIVRAVGASSSDLFAGFSATREAFLAADLSGYKILHLATHAISDSKRPEKSGIVLSGVGKDGSRLDQLVRLQDIYTLNLNADLVVLSACETAAGKELRGEGLLSINNAFIQAGSRSVLSTLWKVDDEATQIFMGRFYESIANGHSASISLKQAQQHLRSQPRFRSPFYWAAFTLHGDPNVAADVSFLKKAWVLAVSGIAILIPVVLLAARYRRR